MFSLQISLATLPKFHDVIRHQALHLVTIGDGSTATVVPMKLRFKGREICNFDEDRIALEWSPPAQVSSFYRNLEQKYPYSSVGDSIKADSNAAPTGNKYFSLVPASAERSSSSPVPARRFSLLNMLSPTVQQLEATPSPERRDLGETNAGAKAVNEPTYQNAADPGGDAGKKPTTSREALKSAPIQRSQLLRRQEQAATSMSSVASEAKFSLRALRPTSSSMMPVEQRQPYRGTSTIPKSWTRNSYTDALGYAKHSDDKLSGKLAVPKASERGSYTLMNKVSGGVSPSYSSDRRWGRASADIPLYGNLGDSAGIDPK